jgi:hypothetical protein
MRRIVIAIVLVAGLCCGPAPAGTIYNNLGPGNTWIINRDYSTNFDFMAAPFVTSGGGHLGDIVIPLFSLHNPVSLGLYADSGGKPGTLLENFSLTAPGFPGILTTIPSARNPLLSAGTEYWLVFTPTPAQKNELAWYENDLGLTGGIWAGNVLDDMLNFVPGSPMPAIQLNSVSVPEPASEILLGSGLLMLAFCRTRVSARIL